MDTKDKKLVNPKTEVDIAKKKDIKKRVQLDFSPDALEFLDNLKKKVGASTRAEVIRDSLSLYFWIADQLEDNYSLQLRRESEIKEVILPIFKNLKMKRNT